MYHGIYKDLNISQYDNTVFDIILFILISRLKHCFVLQIALLLFLQRRSLHASNSFLDRRSLHTFYSRAVWDII